MAPTIKLAEMKDVNFPVDATGRTFHIQARKGEVANRIITVGSHDRGEKLSKMLDDPNRLIIVRSNRAFVVYTGLYNRVPISIVVACNILSHNSFS
jgi:uridine phosphorylase